MTCEKCKIGEVAESQAGWYCRRCLYSYTTLPVGIGVGLKKVGGELVAVVFAGQQGRVDEDACVSAAREALKDWPTHISRLELVVIDPSGDESNRPDLLAAARVGAAAGAEQVHRKHPRSVN